MIEIRSDGRPAVRPDGWDKPYKWAKVRPIGAGSKTKKKKKETKKKAPKPAPAKEAPRPAARGSGVGRVGDGDGELLPPGTVVVLGGLTRAARFNGTTATVQGYDREQQK